MEKKSIDILYIATGGYKAYWNDFYESSERLFLIEYSKKYFVFTDSEEFFQKFSNVEIIKIRSFSWPEATLLRFKFFKDNFDYFKSEFQFFFNANFQFKQIIEGKEILPIKNEISALTWGYFLSKNLRDYPAMNFQSTCISKSIDFEKKYYQGGLFGARKNSFKDLIDFCQINIQNDYLKNRIPQNNDEFYLNIYLNDKIVNEVHHLVGLPEEWNLKQTAKGIFRDKNLNMGFLNQILRKFKTNGILLTIKIIIHKIIK